MSTSHHRRLAKIETIAESMAHKKPTINVSGWADEKISEAVEHAIDCADEDLIEKILGYVDELAAIPLQNPLTKERILDEDGQELPTPHHFSYWIYGLTVGSWHLPKRIPRGLLEGFDDLHGAVLFRCEDCLTGLGNARRYGTCPVCHGPKISVKKLSGPPWDKHWEYTPLPRR